MITSFPPLPDITEDIGPVCPYRVYISLGEVVESGEREGIWKIWVCRSTPPAATRISVSWVGGERLVQHVAPSRDGRGRVSGVEEDENEDKGMS